MILVEPYHKTHRHPCSRVAFVVPVPSHRFHGAGPWGLGRSSGCGVEMLNLEMTKSIKVSLWKRKNIDECILRWKFIWIRIGSLYGFELLTHISCTSNYKLISLRHGRWNPCSRTLLKNHTWASRLRSWLHGNTTFHLLKQVQLLNSILCMCMTATYQVPIYWMNLEGLGAAEIYTSFSTKTSSAPGKFYAIRCHQKNHIQLWWIIES